MASILQQGKSWRAQIRRKGLPGLCQSFPTEDEARQWAHSIESKATAATRDADIYALPRSPVRGQAGVYFLFHGGACVYVGQSRKPHARVTEHIGRILFDEYAVMLCRHDELNSLELHYIKLLKPLYNRKGSSRGPTVGGTNLLLSSPEPA